jgi:lauroyl/myristoyl acyltransferase
VNGAPGPGGHRPRSDLPGSDAALLVPRDVPDVRRLDRWRSSARLHALVPTPLALRATDVLYRAATRARPDRLEAARVGVRAVTPPGTREATITRLATAAVAAQARAGELYHHPRDLAALRVDGLHHLVAARDEGRGVLVSYVHYGPELAWLVLRRHLPIVAVLGDWITEPPPPGYRGLQVEHRRALLVAAGMGAAHAGSPGSATAQVRALQTGGALLTAFDLPGRRPTRYLARTVGLVDSTARMSMMTGAPVLPGTAVPDGASWRIRLHAPLRPATYSSAADLHQALADIHGDAVAAAPAHYLGPVREGMWRSADDTAWYR